MSPRRKSRRRFSRIEDNKLVAAAISRAFEFPYFYVFRRFLFLSDLGPVPIYLPLKTTDFHEDSAKFFPRGNESQDDFQSPTLNVRRTFSNQFQREKDLDRLPSTISRTWLIEKYTRIIRMDNFSFPWRKEARGNREQRKRGKGGTTREISLSEKFENWRRKKITLHLRESGERGGVCVARKISPEEGSRARFS